MAKRNMTLKQNFNNGSAKSYNTFNCDTADMQALVGLFPNGYTVLEPDVAPTGTKKNLPSTTLSLQVLYGKEDTSDGSNSCSSAFFNGAKPDLDVTNLDTLFETNGATPKDELPEYVTVKNVKRV